LTTLGQRWLCQRSRHCLPARPGIFFAISDQFLTPKFLTRSTKARSSSLDHGSAITREYFS
jgi:hypothetical protein